MGGEVPRSYYLNSRPDTNYKKYLSIANGSKEQLQFQVKEPNSLLKYVLDKLLSVNVYYFPLFLCRWDFQSEEGDIAFSVYRKKSGELIPVVSYDRVDCQMSPEEGEIHCEYAGHCKDIAIVLRFFFFLVYNEQNGIS